MTAVFVFPGSPLLIPEISGADAVGLALRSAVSSALQEAGYTDGTQVAGTCYLVFQPLPAECTAPECENSLAPWGAWDTTVDKLAADDPCHALYLPELVARYICNQRGLIFQDLEVSATMPQPDLLHDEDVVFVVLEGSRASDPDGPLQLSDSAPAASEICQQIIQGHITAEEVDLDTLRAASVAQPELWQQLAGLFSNLRELRNTEAKIWLQDSSTGFEYFVASCRWEASHNG